MHSRLSAATSALLQRPHSARRLRASMLQVGWYICRVGSASLFVKTPRPAAEYGMPYKPSSACL
eukprot:5429597-Pleurochrysis_carterae.AAC.1